jgi:glycosyltransferase involved in cell wall biosynthesis
LKILILSNAFPPHIIGGGELAAFNFSRQLAKRGHSVSVLTMAEPGEPEVRDQLSPEGLRIFRLHFPRSYTPYKAQKGDFSPTSRQWKIWNLQDFIDPRGPAIIKKLLAEIRPDHISIQSLPGFGFNALPTLGRAASITWILHDLSLACTRGSMFADGKACLGQCGKCSRISRLKAYFIRKPKHLVFLSPSRANLETVRRYNPAVRDRRGEVIRNVPDPLPADMPAYSPDPRAVRILFVGRLHATKGLGILLEALAPLESKYNFSLTVFGRGPQEDELKAKYGHKTWVSFRGFVPQDDITRAVAAHDLLCTPSLWAEPYGMVTAQALRLGTPVLGSDSGGTAELVRDNETGRLLPPGDIPAWRQAFEVIFSDPSVLQTWRRNAGTYAGEFDEAAILDRYESVMKHAVDL